MQRNILVTGAAGFIGFHLARRLLAQGDKVTGADNVNGYYDVSLKEARLGLLAREPGFVFKKLDIADRGAVEGLFAAGGFTHVVNLAAQPGVRYSLENPRAYIDSNIRGFLEILEGSRHHGVEHLVYASSSSVYGANTELPFSAGHNVDHPVSLYAATKKSNELMAHAYSHLFGLPTTGLRFFTVYGPYDRPDMAMATFTRKIFAGQTLDIYNRGEMRRDFTYVDDIVEGIVRLLGHAAAPDPAWDPQAPDPSSSSAPYKVYNIGNHSPVELLRLIALLEEEIGRKARINLMPMQPGDVVATYADVAELARDVGFSPSTPIETGVKKYVEWHRNYYNAPQKPS